MQQKWAKGAGQAVLGQWTSRVASACLTLTPAMLRGDGGVDGVGHDLHGNDQMSLAQVMSRMEEVAATAETECQVQDAPRTRAVAR